MDALTNADIPFFKKAICSNIIFAPETRTTATKTALRIFRILATSSLCWHVCRALLLCLGKQLAIPALRCMSWIIFVGDALQGWSVPAWALGYWDLNAFGVGFP